MCLSCVRPSSSAAMFANVLTLERIEAHWNVRTVV